MSFIYSVVTLFSKIAYYLCRLCPPIIMGDLIWKFVKILWGQMFFLHLRGDKSLWGELKSYGWSKNHMGGVIFTTTLPLFHFFRNSQHSEKWSVSFKNFLRKCEYIRSYYLLISSNLLKSPLEKLHFLCLLCQMFWKKVFC